MTKAHLIFLERGAQVGTQSYYSKLRREKRSLERPEGSYGEHAHLNNSPTYLNRREVEARIYEGSSSAAHRSTFSALSRARVAPSFANYREWKHTRVTPSNCVTRTDERNRAVDNRARAVVTQRSNRIVVCLLFLLFLLCIYNIYIYMCI